jgi:hypothetical protein
MLYQYWIASSLALLAMTEGILPFPSLRAKAPWPSRGNPSSRRGKEDAISVLDCFGMASLEKSIFVKCFTLF